MASSVRISRSLPQAGVDTNDIGSRGTRYGDQLVAPLWGPKHHLADEGSYFVATNPIPGTAIALTTTITTFVETAGAVCGALFFRNTEVAGATGAKRIYLDYIKLINLTAPTTGVNMQYAITLDDNSARWTSGGSAITPVNPNGDSSATSVVGTTMYFGILTTAVPLNRRLVARGNLKGLIPIIYETFVIVSGGIHGGGASAAASAAANIGRHVDACPPIIVGPSQNLLLSLWFTSTNAASTWEFEMGWWEK